MSVNPAILPQLIEAISDTITNNAQEVTELDQAIGDGDHVFNLQRGLKALMEQSSEFAEMDWVGALQKIGITLMSTIGGASGSLYGTLFVTMSKTAKAKTFNAQTMAKAFEEGVNSVKLRGRAEAGEKTMLDVLIPVALELNKSVELNTPFSEMLQKISKVAISGMESTRDMVATKGRASFLGERSRGHIDAGAKTAQLMICAIAEVLLNNQQAHLNDAV